MYNNIKAILFDMDGVLIDAKEWHYLSLNKALSLFGYEISMSEHSMYYDGLPTETKLHRLSIEKGLPEKLHTFINEMKQKYTIKMIHEHCSPKFHHEYALSRLKSDGYLLAVCSNSIRKTVDLMMTYSNLDQYLEFKMSNQDVIEAKPSPEIYLKAISKLNLKPSECLICEDNENGIAAAKASGAHVYIVKNIEDINYTDLKRAIFQIERNGIYEYCHTNGQK